MGELMRQPFWLLQRQYYLLRCGVLTAISRKT